MKLKSLFPCFATGLLICAAGFPSYAQQSNAPGQNRPVDRRPPAGGPARPMDGAAPVLGVLTEEQRASFERAMQAHREQSRELNARLREARRELMLAGVDGKFDEAAVRKQALAVANLEAELAVQRARAFSQIQPPLTHEQIQRIRSATPAERGAGPGARPAERPARRRILSDANRDENNLPPKR